MYFRCFIIISPYKMGWLSFQQTWIHLTNGFWQVQLKLILWLLRISKFCQCIFAVLLLFPLGKGRGPLCEWISFTEGCFVPNKDEISPAVLEKKMFRITQCIFAICFLSPLKKSVVPYLNNLNSLHLRVIWVKFDSNWTCDGYKEDF